MSPVVEVPSKTSTPEVTGRPPGTAFSSILARPVVAPAVLWSVVGRLPSYAVNLALILSIKERGGSYSLAGLVCAAHMTGIAVVGPWVARLADRWGIRRVLLVTSLGYLPLMLAVVWFPFRQTAVYLGLAVVAGAVVPPVAASMRALWSVLPLAEREREAGYAWEAILNEILVICAPLALSAGLFLGSAGTALAAGVVLISAGGCGLALTRPIGTAPTLVGARGAGVSPLRSPRFVVLLGVIAVCAACLGLNTLAIPALADAHGSLRSAGLVYSCWGVGSLFGGIWYAQRRFRTPPEHQLPWAVLAFAIGSGLPVLAYSQMSLGILLAVGGVPISVITICEMSLTRALIQPRTLVEAFSWLSTVTVVGDACGQLLAGVLLEQVTPRAVFTMSMSLSLLLGAGLLAMRDRLLTG